MTILIQSKKAHFNYEIIEKYEAGIELFGFEVKAIKMKKGSLEGSFVIIRGSEAYLTGFDLPPYQAQNTPKDYDSTRIRKLLLTKKEIKTLIGKSKVGGLTIIPISMYNKNNKIKVEIALVRPKKKHDKRETIKKREGDREIRRILKNN